VPATEGATARGPDKAKPAVVAANPGAAAPARVPDKAAPATTAANPVPASEAAPTRGLDKTAPAILAANPVPAAATPVRGPEKAPSVVTASPVHADSTPARGPGEGTPAVVAANPVQAEATSARGPDPLPPLLPPARGTGPQTLPMPPTVVGTEPAGAVPAFDLATDGDSDMALVDPPPAPPADLQADDPAPAPVVRHVSRARVYRPVRRVTYSRPAPPTPPMLLAQVVANVRRNIYSIFH